MEDAHAIRIMSALAQSTRLKIFTLLARRTGGMTAGAIAEAVGAPSSTMSAHLSILSHAGLLSSEKFGRSVVYVAKAERLEDLIAFLARNVDGMGLR